MFFLLLYIFAFLSEPPSLAIVKISSFFLLWFRNNYLPCQIHPEKLDTPHRSPGNRNEARLKQTRGKFMSAIYQLWIWGVVMVIWRSFLRVLFPLSSFALARGEQFRSSGRGSPIFCFLWFVSIRRRGVSQCKISARPEIIKQQQQHGFAISGN